MPARKRNLKRHAAPDPDEQAWLRGDLNCGFVQFMPDDKLGPLWETYGDHDAFVWRRGMDRPERL
jgi:hypothetical protein